MKTLWTYLDRTAVGSRCKYRLVMMLAELFTLLTAALILLILSPVIGFDPVCTVILTGSLMVIVWFVSAFYLMIHDFDNHGSEFWDSLS